jgi:LysM repeat protein
VQPAKRRSRIPAVTLSLPVALGLLALFLIAGSGLTFLAVQNPEGAIATVVAQPTETLTPTASATNTPSPTPETPTATPSPLPSPTPLSYIVQDGDLCTGIAFVFDISVQSIVLLNNLAADCPVFVGQTLLLPHPTPTPSPFPTDTPNPEQATIEACDKVVYEVQIGDTLSTISANYGVPIDAIRDWNGLPGEGVFSGQELIIPLCEQSLFGPTQTPTIPPPYVGPNLLLPVDGHYFDVTDDTITLQWATVGTLRDGEFYMIIIEDITSGGERRLVDYVTDTKFIIPASFRPDSNVPHVFRWWIGTVRQVGTNEDGLPTYEPAGELSDPRVFTWAGIQAPTPQP